MRRPLALLWILACAALMTSCAANVTLRGELAAPTGAGPRIRPRLADAVVWLDSIPAPAERRIRHRRAETTVLFSRHRFSRRVVVAPVESPARIENRDGVYHMPFSMTRAGAHPLGIARPASAMPLALPPSGAVPLFCRIHSSEEVWVRVVPNHAYACADRFGRFRLPAVPNGTYLVRAWHPELGETSASIEVRGTHTTPIALRFPGGTVVPSATPEPAPGPALTGSPLSARRARSARPGP